MKKIAWFTIVLVVLFVVGVPLVALAQEEITDTMAVAIQIDWRQVLALLINSVLVVIAVQLLKTVLPLMPGWAKQVLALAAGPLLTPAAAALSALLGYPIDFGPLIAVFAGISSGFAAMGLFDVTQKVGKSVA